MRCLLLPLIVLLGSAHAAPFFRLRFGPEHRTGEDVGPELPSEPLPQDVPQESSAVFALQVPKIDLSDLFRPLRVFAGVNVDHPTAISVREEEPNCDLGKFDLTDEEFDVVMDCQELVGDNKVELKECILTKLPKTSVELREFLDREEFGVAGLSSSFHLALRDGEFTQTRSVQFRLCPRDEVNSIDSEEVVPVVQQVVPVVEEMVPIQALNPDRVDGVEPELGLPTSGAIIPPQRPLFQFPELKLPDFGQIFTEALAPVFGPQPGGGEGDSGLGLFGSHLNPFAVRPPPAAQAGPQQGFFASLFPALAATPPPQGHPDGIDMTKCSSKKFEVSRFVFNVANRCQYANDYRKCLRLDLADDESAIDLLEFAVDPNYSVVASSFSSFQTTFDLEALHSGKGVLDTTRKNQIDLRRCANIVEEEVPETTETAIEEAAAASELAPEAAEGVSVVPEVTTEVIDEATPAVVDEVTPVVVDEVTPEGVLDVVPETTPEEVPVVLAEYPSEPAPGAEVAAEVIPEVTPEVAPDAIPEVAPEVTPEVIPGVATEVTPEVAPGVTPEVAPEVTPEVFEATPEAPVEATVDAEKAAAEAEKASAEAPVEAEKAVVEAEKAAAGVENPAEESKPVDSTDNVQTDSVYGGAEP